MNVYLNHNSHLIHFEPDNWRDFFPEVEKIDSIRFTMELETNGFMTFLDVLVERC